MEETTLLTNMQNSERLATQSAINMYKFVDPTRHLWIEDTAFDNYGNQLSNHFSLHDSGTDNLGVFWLVHKEVTNLLQCK